MRSPRGFSLVFPLLLLTLLASACAAPIRRAGAAQPLPGAGLAAQRPAPRNAAESRPAVGIAFGGGSARGIAHVGVIRWFEEHRIPIDVAAGTSMGGLIGGSFASGMDADELEGMLNGLNWDEIFGSSSFDFKNIRRKNDARAYPSRLEFGIKRGIVPPTSLNNGEQVELLLGRIAAPYYDLASFDQLPTPFRAVAVDLVSATEVVLNQGSLAQAMRATMSLPLIFPPVEVDGRILVDGGAMNNVPADVVRQMGADRVIAVNVGDLTDRETVNASLLGLAGATLDAMMRASTKKSIAGADVIINVPLKEYGSLDWRRSKDLIGEGYKAAEAMREALLPLAVSEAEYERWKQSRQGRRLTTLPVPAFVTVDGFSRDDQRRLDALLARHVGVPFNIEDLQDDLAVLSGLDRYETITWRIVPNDAGDRGLLISGRVKPFAPPFLMLGVNLENTTSSDFRITMTGRYLAFGVLGSGSELRVDGTLGSDPGAWIELYQPLRSSPLFVAPYAGVGKTTADFVEDDAVVARYGQTYTRMGLNLGSNLGRLSDIRLGGYIGRVDASVDVGNPGLPDLAGKETIAELLWRFDGQDSPAVPSRGTYANMRLHYVFDAPEVSANFQTDRSSVGLTQLAGRGTRFWSLDERNRLFVVGGLGTSFDGLPLANNQFTMGSAFRLGAYGAGEIRGDHYYAATGGYLRQLGRLPDFMGGPVFAGGWLENGDAFNDWADATWRTNASAGVIMDTLLGPVIVAGSYGFDGRWRTYFGVGRIFR
jgi:NTE family protein